MKKIFLVLSLAVFMISCGGSSVTGSWTLESVSGEELTEAEKSTTFTLNEDGSFKMTRDGESEERKGTWEWSDDKKDIILKDENGEIQEEMKEVTLEGDLMKFKSRSDEITLKKK